MVALNTKPAFNACQPADRAATPLRTLRAETHRRLNDELLAFIGQARVAGATLFQNRVWLRAWYEEPGRKDSAPLVVCLRRRDDRRIMMLLPLVRRVENGLSVICFADGGASDYNAPLIADDFAPRAEGGEALLRMIVDALPPADLLRLDKMPMTICGRINPLIDAEGVHPGPLTHWAAETGDDWEAYWNGRKRGFRKDQRRRLRVLRKKGDAEFLRCRDSQQADALFDVLLRQQKARLDGLGLPYLLDQPSMQRFYRRVIRDGVADGPVILTALTVDGLPIATLCGLGDGRRYAMTLSGNEPGEWSKCSPGRLLTEWTMRRLHQGGYRYFDFTIGDEGYKKDFAQEAGRLVECSRSLSWKALPHIAVAKARVMKRKVQTALPEARRAASLAATLG